MRREYEVPLFDLVRCLSEAMDLVSPALSGHHKQVAYIASAIAAEWEASAEEQNDVLLGGMLHDVGALSLRERLGILQFDLKGPFSHAEMGYLLLTSFKPFSRIATLVRYHHLAWDEVKGSEAGGGPVALGSHALHLADRVSVLIDRHHEVLGQVAAICRRIEMYTGTMFAPHLVEAFMSLAERECFWLDAVSPRLDSILAEKSRLGTVEVGMEILLQLARLFSKIIDFRSRFTATHSCGVAACAEALSRLAGLSERECTMMKVAGYLHDLGKLAVPTEILEKPGPLTADERNVVRAHTYYTYRILGNVHQLDEINSWASFHHERLDGKGYPFHHQGHDITLAQRIMAVSDAFTALTEERPYRKGMTKDEALQTLQRMAQDSAFDSNLVSLLRAQFNEIDSLRRAAQAAAAEEYEESRRSLTTH